MVLVLEIFSGRQASHSLAGTRSARQRMLCSAGRFEIHVCTNKTCKKQGSLEVLKFAQDLGLEELKVEGVGCLGGCGTGPNMILVPGTVPLRHISTPARMTEVLRTLCSLDVPDSLLKATELRLAGNAEARSGDLQRAVELYSQALDLRPPRGAHMLLSNRSGARLALGDVHGAAQDADAAASLSPPGFHTAYVRQPPLASVDGIDFGQVEAHAALGRYREADSALHQAAAKDPSFRPTREFRQLASQILHLGSRV